MTEAADEFFRQDAEAKGVPLTDYYRAAGMIPPANGETIARSSTYGHGRLTHDVQTIGDEDIFGLVGQTADIFGNPQP